ncbi:MAG TPA: hypothetical protein VNC11_11415 [Gemmatimonadaceae bacterium]|nr:hypothetical protein [Gemmatimonadaceae bacterium]
MHGFQIWMVFAFVLAATAIQSVTKIITVALERHKSLPPRGLQEIAEKTERMSQAIDAMAIEVERIGESQRFLTRVLSDKSAPQIEDKRTIASA